MDLNNALGRKVTLAAVAVIFFGLLAFALFDGTTYELRITVPAGSQEDYVFSSQEVSSGKGTVTVSSGDGLGDAMVILDRVDGAGSSAAYLTPGMPVDLEVVPDTWYRVGIAQQNPTGEDQEAVVVIEGDIELRIE